MKEANFYWKTCSPISPPKYYIMANILYPRPHKELIKKVASNFHHKLLSFIER
jgi:hypothetical protein